VKEGNKIVALYKRGKIWWYEFIYTGQRIQESSNSRSKTVALEAERKRRRECEEGFNALEDRRKDRIRTLSALAVEYLKEYALKHRALTFAEYAVGHFVRHVGSKLVVEIGEKTVKDYQIARLQEKASPKSINEEVGFLLRLMGAPGELLRAQLRRQKALKLTVDVQPGKAFSEDEKERMLAVAARSRSRSILPALTLALNAGMRDSEIKRVRWSQIDFVKAILTVGKSKSVAGAGRTIPLNTEVLDALIEHAKWYSKRFREMRPEWYIFPFGPLSRLDPSRPVTSLKKAWTNVRKKASVSGRWHDARHTLITELAESGAGDQTIMDIAGHVSRQMLARYSHIRTEAKRNALEEVSRRRQQVRAKTAAASETGQKTKSAGAIH
jgi:integrase